MWLLNTKTATLRQFRCPEDVPGGYAILSHVWGKMEEEDTFEAVKNATKMWEENAARNNTSSSLEESNTLSEKRLEGIVAQLQETIRNLESTVSALSRRVDQLE